MRHHAISPRGAWQCTAENGQPVSFFVRSRVWLELPSAENGDALILVGVETATNIIRHARLLVGDATITCRISREDEALVVELIYPRKPSARPPNCSLISAA